MSSGGAERVTSLLTSSWAESGHTVFLITFEQPGSAPYYRLHKDVNLIQLGPENKNKSGLFKRNAQKFLTLWKTFRGNNPDLIVSFMIESNIPSILAGRIAGVPVVVSERVHPGYHNIGLIRSFVRRVVYPFAHSVVVQTREIAEWMEYKYGVVCDVIPNPVADHKFYDYGKTYQFKSKHNIVAAGRLCYQKGFDILIAAFACISDKYPDWGLVIFGDGPDRHELTNLAEQHGLSSRIEFPGVIENLPEVFKKADLFVHSARYEGFPNVLLEALSANLPCVACDSPGGVNEILNEGTYGIQVPISDPDVLSVAIDTLIQDQKLLRHYASTAHEALKRYEINRICRLWEGLFKCVSYHKQNASDRLKISIVINQLLDGGAERHLKNILPMLSLPDYEVSVVNLSGRGSNTLELAAKGIPVLRPFPKGIFSFLPESARLISDRIRSLFFLYFYFRKYKPKLVHFFLPEAYLIGAFPAIFSGVPHLVMSRRSLNNYATNHKIMASLERKLHSRMNRIFANSLAVYRQLKDEGVEDSKMVVLYNGINCNEYVPVSNETKNRLRESRGFGRDTLIIIVVANLIHYKGHMDVIKAMTLISSDLKSDWKLLFIGRDDGIKAELSKQSEYYGLNKNIIFLGDCDDVIELMQFADIGVLASHQEGFSNTILESMACGLPMVVSDAGGNTEAIENEITGLVVPVRRPDMLAKSILRLAISRALREEFSEAGRLRVASKFTIEDCSASYTKQYKEILNIRST